MSSSTTRPPRAALRGRNHAGKNRRPPPKPSKGRYLYDEDAAVDEQSVGGVSCLGGLEDDQSERTNKMHNLSSVKYGRRFPKHHSGYRHRQQHGKRVRFQQDDETPFSALTEDAIMSHCSESMEIYSVSDDDDDSEHPTNTSHSSETRSTADSSFDDEAEQIRLMVEGEGSQYEEEDYDQELVSIGIVSRDRTKHRPLLERCLPSANTMSRWFFLLGCVLTFWMAIDSLSWAKEQQERQEGDGSQRLRRKLYTHQEQWDDNSTWGNLQKGQQDSWSQLGFTEEQWNDHDGVDSDNIEWGKLSEGQQEAAEDLGFTPSVWDHAVNETESPGPETAPARGGDLPSLDLIIATSVAVTPVSPGTSPPTSAPPTSPPPPPTASSITSPPTTSQTSTNTTSTTNKDTAIFTVVNGSISVTKYMVLSFAAALCFTMVGIIEWIQHDYLFQLLLAISGVWGLLSAMFIERNPDSAVAFHTLSVHCFLGAAVSILWLRCRQTSMPANSRSGRVANRTMQESLLLADLCFAVGSTMAVISSYLTLVYGLDQVELMVDIQRFDVFAAILWVACAAIYLCCTYKANLYQVE